jgi:hypothetical protein
VWGGKSDRARYEINSQGRNVWLLTEKERRRSRQEISLKKERRGKKGRRPKVINSSLISLN